MVQCWWNSVVEQWNGETVLGKQRGGAVMVDESGGTVEPCWWNSGTVDPWNSGTVKVEQCGGTLE